MIKGNHILTMNDNIISIAHKKIKENMVLNILTDFRLNSKEEPIKYGMFNAIDDIMKILKDNEDIDELNLVSKNLLIMCIMILEDVVMNQV